MRPRSAKRQRQYATERIPLVRRFLADNPVCWRCFRAASTDVHEIKSRARGGSITEVSNLAPLCRACHDHITQNPAEAERAGWAKNSWEN